MTLWALNAKVKRWLPIMTDLHPAFAVDEMATRQDRVRRSGEPCIFKVLPDGDVPY